MVACLLHRQIHIYRIPRFLAAVVDKRHDVGGLKFADEFLRRGYGNSLLVHARLGWCDTAIDVGGADVRQWRGGQILCGDSAVALSTVCLRHVIGKTGEQPLFPAGAGGNEENAVHEISHVPFNDLVNNWASVTMGNYDGMAGDHFPQEGTFMTPRHIDLPEPGESGCRATREILERIGDKWSLYVVGALRVGPRRFNELKRDVNGVSQRMLTLTLRGLERDGLVTRTVFPSIPPRVDYELTELGRTLLEPVAVLIQWATSSRAEIEAARSNFDSVSQDTP